MTTISFLTLHTCDLFCSSISSKGFIAHLGTLGAQLTANDDLDTLGAILHDESAQGEPMATRQKTNSKPLAPEDTIAGTAHCQTTNQLEAEGLTLGLG